MARDQNPPAPTRRVFLQVSALAGGGMALGLSFGTGAEAADAATDPHVLSAWVEIHPGGKIVITGKNPEVGQGVKTSLPMMIAEELDCEWSQVEVRQADFNPALYGPQVAGGSQSTPQNWLPLRQAGAVARRMLLQAASARSSAPISELTTARGVVHHAASGRKWTYGELAEAAARAPAPDPASVPLKDPKAFTIMGRRQVGVDSARILHGEPLFGIDTHLPGQLYAIFESAPAHGGLLKHADVDAARKAPGVVAVLPLQGVGGPDALVDGVAVVATNYWYAEQARALLQLEWDLSSAKGHGDAAYDEQAGSLMDAGGGDDLLRDGDAAARLKSAARTVSARYSFPFLAHVSLEPQNCTALYRDDGVLELWAPTQNPQAGVGLIAQHLGIPAQQQLVHITRIGGGFGRRLMGDYMVQAAAIAKAMPGKPIQLIYSRADDIKRDFYRSGGWHAFEAGLDASGKLIAFRDHFITVGADNKPARGARLNPNHFPAGLVEDLLYTQSVLPTVMPTGYLRAPESNAHGFAFQSFLDEVAEAGGKDLPTLLLELCAQDKVIGPTGDPSRASPAFLTDRARAVIRKVVQDSDWANRPRQKGRAKGFGFYFSHLGYFAEVADVSVGDDGVKVHKVWVAADVGSQIVNPMGAENQVRGAIIDGLAQALGQKITFTDGVVDQKNFNSFPPARMPVAPEIEISWILSDHPPSGLGEPALPPLLPAVTNAVYAATGKRLRSLPIRL